MDESDPPIANDPEPLLAEEAVETRALPATLGRYHLRSELGRGSLGVVFRAYDPIHDREVALKVRPFDGAQPELIERFLREVRSAAELSHPHIVKVYDCGTDGDVAYVASEYVEGRPLSRVMGEWLPSHRQSAQWIRDLALMLHSAHERGLVHGDVRPSNVMIDGANQARLMDFGLRSSARPADPTHAGDIPGASAYLAPEQARGDHEAVGPHSDQYSLGVILYELLAGRKPYLGTPRELLARTTDPSIQPPRPRDQDPSISPELEAVALKALEKNPADRYAAAADMAIDLQRSLKGQSIDAPLLVTSELIRICPSCDRRSPIARTSCMYCGQDFHGVAAIESDGAAGYWAAPSWRKHRSGRSDSREAGGTSFSILRVVGAILCILGLLQLIGGLAAGNPLPALIGACLMAGGLKLATS